MPSLYNPSDIARLGHRFQVYVLNPAATPTKLVASRVQSIDNSIRQDTTIYHEIGTVDPVGYSSDSPEFRVVLNEFVHAEDLDLLLAGKILASDTSWNLGNYNVGNGPYQVRVLERDNNGVIQGELDFFNGTLSEIQWQWRMGQPIDARYTFEFAGGKHWAPGSTPDVSWAAQDVVSPGGIKIKDARLFIGGTTQKFFRVQGFTLRATWKTTVVREAGTRPMVGILAEPPDVMLDVDVAFADAQPDNVLYAQVSAGGTYYDYQNYQVLTGNYIRVYDPAAAEGASVLRTWKLENLVASNASPLIGNVRGLSTKRYSLLVPNVTTPGTAGLLFGVGNLA